MKRNITVEIINNSIVITPKLDTATKAFLHSAVSLSQLCVSKGETEDEDVAKMSILEEVVVAVIKVMLSSSMGDTAKMSALGEVVVIVIQTMF